MKGETSTSLRDLAGNAKVREAANLCMALIDAVQVSKDPGARLLALACAFLMAAEQAGIQVTDLMTYARNCMNEAQGKRPEFQAVANYIQKEIFNG